MIPDTFKTRKTCLIIALVAILIACFHQGKAEQAKSKIDPTTVLWYTHPADKWENALPVGNGRLLVWRTVQSNSPRRLEAFIFHPKIDFRRSIHKGS